LNSFTIKDLEILSGIKAHTIRIWEQRYALLKPQRTDTNIRYYSNDELKNLLNIALLNKYGYKISHITNMSQQQVKDKILLLNNAEANIEKIITELIQYMVDMEMEQFESILNKFISSKGIERTINQIIFPFLDKIGILWQTDNVNPAQEHIVTNIIRQKLIVGIENVVPFFGSKKTVLLFMPEGEHHEMGLLYVNFMMKSRGIKTIYLGANVPTKDLGIVIEVKKPDFLYSHITSLHTTTGFDKFITQCKIKIPDSQLIISGLQAQLYTKSLPNNIQLKKSIAQVMDFITSLQN
jgi:MerR family transcriptional regulator, light-induced transcriptional regulator